MPKHAWRATRARSALLGNLHPSSDMANRAILFDSIHLARMAQPAIGFCHGIPASARGDAPLLILATMIQMKGYDPKIPYTQAQTQCVRAEAGRKSVEPIHGQGMKSIGFIPSKSLTIACITPSPSPSWSTLMIASSSSPTRKTLMRSSATGATALKISPSTNKGKLAISWGFKYKHGTIGPLY